MYSTIIFLSIVILVLSVMLIFYIQVEIDLVQLIIKIHIKVFCLKIITININLLYMKYTFNKSKKTRNISLIISEKEKYLIKQIKKSILDKVYYDHFNIIAYLNIGDADKTAEAVGVIIGVCNVLNSIFISSKKTYDLSYEINGCFIENKNVISIETKVYFTIFDIMFAFIMSFYKRGKYVKENK